MLRAPLVQTFVATSSLGGLNSDIMKRNPLPPADYLVACFTYDPVTGDMYWKHRPQEHFKNRNAWLGFTTTRAGRLAGQRRFRRNGKPSVVAIPITVDGQS